MGEILVMTSAFARQCRLSGCGSKTAPGDGSVRAIFLGGKSRGSVAFGNPRFSGGKSLVKSKGIKIKEQKRARERKRRGLRNLRKESLERSQGRRRRGNRRRGNCNEEHCKAERNRARDKTLIYNGWLSGDVFLFNVYAMLPDIFCKTRLKNGEGLKRFAMPCLWHISTIIFIGFCVKWMSSRKLLV